MRQLTFIEPGTVRWEEAPDPRLEEMYTRGVRFVTGRVNARPAIPEILTLVQAGSLHPELVNSAVVPWERADEVILADQLKPVFVRDIET